LLGEALVDGTTSRSACNASLSQFSCVTAPRSDREHSRHGASRTASVCFNLPVRTVHEQIIVNEAHHVDWIEAQLHEIIGLGYEHYVLEQGYVRG